MTAPRRYQAYADPFTKQELVTALRRLTKAVDRWATHHCCVAPLGHKRADQSAGADLYLLDMRDQSKMVLRMYDGK